MSHQEIGRDKTVNPNQFKEGLSGKNAEWSTETHRELARELVDAGVQRELDELKDKNVIGALKVHRGDTLGTLVKALKGGNSLDWSQKVEYRSDRMLDLNRSEVEDKTLFPSPRVGEEHLQKTPDLIDLKDANLIYPDQYVWIENGRIIVADELPAQPDSTKPEPITEKPEIEIEDPNPEFRKECRDGVIWMINVETGEATPTPELCDPEKPEPEEQEGEENYDTEYFYAAPGAATRGLKALASQKPEAYRQARGEVDKAARRLVGQRDIRAMNNDTVRNVGDGYTDAVNRVAFESGVDPERTKDILQAMDDVAKADAGDPAKMKLDMENLSRYFGPDFNKVAEKALKASEMSGVLAYLRSPLAQKTLKGVVVAGTVGLHARAWKKDFWVKQKEPASFGLLEGDFKNMKPRTGNQAVDTAQYFIPFYGNTLDFADARMEYKNGNYGLMTINVVSGTVGMALDVVSYGLAWTGIGLVGGQGAKVGVKAALRGSIAAVKSGFAGRMVGKLSGGINKGLEWVKKSPIGKVGTGLGKLRNAVFNNAKFSLDKAFGANKDTKVPKGIFKKLAWGAKETGRSIYNVVTANIWKPKTAVNAGRTGGEEIPEGSFRADEVEVLRIEDLNKTDVAKAKTDIEKQIKSLDTDIARLEKQLKDHGLKERQLRDEKSKLNKKKDEKRIKQIENELKDMKSEGEKLKGELNTKNVERNGLEEKLENEDAIRQEINGRFNAELDPRGIAQERSVEVTRPDNVKEKNLTVKESKIKPKVLAAINKLRSGKSIQFMTQKSAEKAKQMYESLGVKNLDIKKNGRGIKNYNLFQKGGDFAKSLRQKVQEAKDKMDKRLNPSEIAKAKANASRTIEADKQEMLRLETKEKQRYKDDPDELVRIDNEITDLRQRIAKREDELKDEIKRLQNPNSLLNLRNEATEIKRGLDDFESQNLGLRNFRKRKQRDQLQVRQEDLKNKVIKQIEAGELKSPDKVALDDILAKLDMDGDHSPYHVMKDGDGYRVDVEPGHSKTPEVTPKTVDDLLKPGKFIESPDNYASLNYIKSEGGTVHFQVSMVGTDKVIRMWNFKLGEKHLEVVDGKIHLSESGAKAFKKAREKEEQSKAK